MAVLYTYDDTSRREDVSDLLDLLEVKETQLMTGLPKVKASNTYHEWVQDSLSAAADNAQVEGTDFSSSTISAPTRGGNITQIFKKQPQVSGTEIAVDQAGIEDAFSYQVTKNMKELKNDIEFALMRGSTASGTGSAARRLDGVWSCITTLSTSHASGTTLTESILNDKFEAAWDNGGVIDEIYVGAKLKRRISSFTANSTRNVNSDDKRLVSPVDVYESDFGIHKIFKHRYIQQSTDATGRLVGLDSQRWAVAQLRPAMNEVLAKTGDHMRSQLIAELTLECRNESANFKADGLLLQA